jgi:glucose/arabinose dehydrogenase
MPNARTIATLAGWLLLTAGPMSALLSAGAALAQTADSPVKLLTGQAAFGDWSADAPGVRRHITAADLPAPFATPSGQARSVLGERPAGATLKLPPGFTAAEFATDLQNPRTITVAPNGDIFIAETAPGQILVMRAADGASQPSETRLFANNLSKPFGIAFYPNGANPQYVYVGTGGSVVRFPYQNGDLKARGPAETIVPDYPDGGGHYTRDIAFSPDNSRLYISVGSQSNVAENMPRASKAEIAATEKAHGLGASWGAETQRADVLVTKPDGSGGLHNFANGIRNCAGLGVQPGTGDVWCATNERDLTGDDLPPDYVTRVKEGAFYGWPWYYMGSNEDPRHKGERPDLAGRVTVPDVMIQPHSAPLQIAFYTGTQFPSAYRGDAFVTLHGSWNRSTRTGYKVVRLIMKDGKPTGEYEDFMTGMAVEGGVWARPVGIAVAHDGALLVSEDSKGILWRISYQGAK